jgi:hypothetical protein
VSAAGGHWTPGAQRRRRLWSALLGACGVSPSTSRSGSGRNPGADKGPRAGTDCEESPPRVDRNRAASLQRDPLVHEQFDPLLSAPSYRHLVLPSPRLASFPGNCSHRTPDGMQAFIPIRSPTNGCASMFPVQCACAWLRIYAEAASCCARSWRLDGATCQLKKVKPVS